VTQLRVALLTREYPPEVYGGAGVHVTYLARELAGLVDLTVHCQGTGSAVPTRRCRRSPPTSR
jgi:alpha-maltose-1-phosphate synthase